jgi:DNA-directed RNA polymerase specialized sigma24 family protein
MSNGMCFSASTPFVSCILLCYTEQSAQPIIASSLTRRGQKIRMEHKHLDSASIKDLARACAQQTSHSRAPVREPDPCYELFRRAFSRPPDDDAWQAILDQYHRLVRLWLGQHASDDTVQEVFLRFWKAQKGGSSAFTARFPNIKAVMGYLKRCCATVRIEAERQAEKRRRLQERLREAAQLEMIITRARPSRGHTDLDFKQLVLSKIKDESEQAVFEGAYHYDLGPRDIQALRPDLFPDVRTVYRVKENLVRRLRRDHELEGYWVDRCKDDGDGGKTGDSPV